MTPDPTPTPDAPAERLPWTPPTLTVIDLADRTQAGSVDFSNEDTYTRASRYPS